MTRRLPAVLFGLATLLLGTSSWSMAAISFIKTINATSSTTTGTSLTIIVPVSGVAAGNRAIVTIALNPSTGTVACSDTGGNSYAVDSNVANGSGTTGVRTVILSAQVTTALVGGNNITCTHPSVIARALSAHEFSGLATTATVDKVASSTGNNTAPSSGAITTTVQASELLVGAIGVEGPTTETFTAGASYTVIGRAGTSGGTAANNITVNPEYRIVSATGAFSASGTLSTSRRWATPIVTYKAAATAIPTKLSITSINSGADPTAGVGFPVIVQSQDAGGIATNVPAVTGVSLSLKTGTGTLGGTLTGTIAAGTNQVTISGTTYTKAENGVAITATRTSGDTLTAGDSVAFTVVPGAATQLVFTTQPGNTAAGSSLSGPPTVTVRDAQGKTVTSSSASITVAIGTNPGGGTLSGTISKNAISGIVGYSDLSINQPGNGYTLSATSNGLTSAISATFNIIGTNGTIGGVVSQSGSGASIGGALVEVLQSGVLKGSITTAANGSYSISPLAPGSYDVRASAAGYGAQTQNAQSVATGTITTVNFSLASGPSISSISPSSGSIAALVTISGFNFGATQGSSTVKFNGIVAIPNSWSNNSVIVPIPNGASTGSVVVTVGGFASNTVNFSVQASAAISYVYDKLGRLRAVTDPNSDTAVYNYDAVGNLLTISRQNSGLVSIVEFSPASGPAGTNVTIYGTGFSTTLTQNAVVFNGVAATVTSSTQTKIVATVPGGASTGLIAVTGPGGSAASSTAFTVTASSGIPTITSFTPTIGTPGTPVTITGTNFDTIPSKNATRFNIGHAILSTVASTSLSTIMPSGIGSGRISVTTILGKGVSASDFFMPPSPYTVADVAHTGRMPTGGSSHTVSISLANKIGLVTFDGTAGQRVSLQITNLTIAQSDVAVIRPDGTNLIAPQYIASTNFLDAMTLPITGTYTILVDPRSTYTGNMTLMLYDVPQATETIVIGGSAVTVTTTIPGQNGKVTFSGTANQRVSLRLTSVTIFNSDVSIQKPDGTNLVLPTYFSTGGGFFDTLILPTTGTYAIFINPRTNETGSMTLTLYDVPQDFTATIVPGGSPVTVTTTIPGQDGKVTFSGTANQRVSLRLTSVTIVNSDVSIQKPDGTNLVLPTYFSTGGGFFDTLILPTTGTYAIFINPRTNETGSMTLTLYDVPQDFTATIVPGGSPVTVTTTIPGQNGKVTFSGTANQRVSLRLTSVTIFNSDVSIQKPDGTNLVLPTYFSTGGGFFDTLILPTTGTYAIFINPRTNETGSMTLTLYDVPQDFTATIVPGGSPVTVTTTIPGQDGKVTFSGTANQRVSLRLTSVTIVNSDVSIQKPDGTNLVLPTYFSTGGGFFDTLILPTTGTYAIFINPRTNETGSMTLTLYDVPQDFTATIVPGGSPVTVTTTIPGQDGKVTFSGTANQRVSLRLTSVTIVNSDVSIQKPDGTNLVLPTYFSNGGGFFDTLILPTTGTYAIFINPRTNETGSMTLTLYDVVDVTGTVIVGGASVPVSITTVGQRAILTFAGTASQQITVRITNNTIPWMTVQLNKPDGTQLTASSSGSASFNLSTQTLPSTGTYSIVVDPQSTNLGNLSVSVTNP